MSASLRDSRRRFWLETDTGSLAATWFMPADHDATDIAVVIVSGIAHEDRIMSTGLAAIAEACAVAGLATLLFDLQGTAQSSGTLDDLDIVERWPNDVQAVVQHCRSLGFRRIVVVGIRTGALIALVGLASKGVEGVDALVMWAPVTSGRRYARELQLMQSVSNMIVRDQPEEGSRTIEIGGFRIPSHVVTALKRLTMTSVSERAADAVLIIDAHDRSHSEVAHQLRASGSTVTHFESTETLDWLSRSTDGSAIPNGDIQDLVAWIADTMVPLRVPGRSLAESTANPTRSFLHAGRTIRETLLTVPVALLSAVWCEVADGDNSAPTRLIAPAVGPGRSFVEFARDQAAAGYSSLRYDLPGFGTSPRLHGHKTWTGYYSPDGAVGIRAAIDFTRSLGNHRIILIGICATAWSSIQVADRIEVVGVVGVNLFMHVPATRMSILNNADVPQWIAALDRWLDTDRRARAYHALYRRLPLPAAPFRWADILLAKGIPLLLYFDDTDASYSYFLQRRPRRWHRYALTGELVVSPIQDLGHALEGPAGRRTVLQKIAAALQRFDGSPMSESTIEDTV